MGTFEVRLDGALSNLVWLKMTLLAAGGLGWMTSKGLFQPKAFYDSMKCFYVNIQMPTSLLQLACF